MEASFVVSDHEKFPSGSAMNNDKSDLNEALVGEEEKRMELFQLLLKSGHMIGEDKYKYDEAAEMVTKCKQLSCQMRNTTQRLGYYVSAALQERIERQTLRVLNNAAKPLPYFGFDIAGEFNKEEFSRHLVYCTRVLHLVRVMQFTSAQAIIDTVGNAQKIHVIALGIRMGSHWTVLMEYLAHRSFSSDFPGLQLLKITAVGMHREDLIKSGERLQQLAESLAIPFSYNTVEIARMEEIKEGLFTVESGEALAVHAPFVLRTLLYEPVLLENLLSVTQKLRPSIMLSVETEAQHNSPSFADRFSEVLFYYMAYFDMVDVSMTDRSDIRRMKHEELLPGSHMRNMIVYDGKERFVRHVGTDVWRRFFKQAGFSEKSFSFRGMYQAQLLIRECGSTEHCSLDADGHAIIVKWKSTPLYAVSAWSAV